MNLYACQYTCVGGSACIHQYVHTCTCKSFHLRTYLDLHVFVIPVHVHVGMGVFGGFGGFITLDQPITAGFLS